MPYPSPEFVWERVRHQASPAKQSAERVLVDSPGLNQLPLDNAAYAAESQERIFVRARSVNRWHRHIEQSQIHGKLPSVMIDVTKHDHPSNA